MNFKQKKILVTGATGVIGCAIIKKFLSLGATVLGSGTNIKKLESLEKEFPQLLTQQFDISNHLEIDEFIEKASKNLGGLDILINNAGITKDNLSIRMKNEEWQKVLDINLTSTFYLCKSAIKRMLKNKFGRVVNITSIVGHTGNIGQTNYSASKAGIVALSKSMAIEYAKKNITINCVSPGFIQTSMTDNINEQFKSQLISRIPMNRLGSGEDVSNTVAFLSSEDASYITGETIHVNGGMYMA
jgi:3-oxoacyl-[acyl-carrier protein] reductase